MSTHADGAPRSGRASRRRGATSVTLALVALVVTSGLAACGGGETADKAPAAPATARDALVAYLDMLERGQFGDLDRVATPRYVDNHGGDADTKLDAARLVDVALEPEQGGDRTRATMTVYIDPGPGNGVWGDEAGERRLFAYLVQTDEGSWLIDDFGTGP